MVIIFLEKIIEDQEVSSKEKWNRCNFSSSKNVWYGVYNCTKFAF